MKWPIPDIGTMRAAAEDALLRDSEFWIIDREQQEEKEAEERVNANELEDLYSQSPSSITDLPQGFLSEDEDDDEESEISASIDLLEGYLALLDAEEMLAGGPGSGCHGDNCGRPPEPGGEEEKRSSTPREPEPAPAGAISSAELLKQYGWKKGAKAELKGKPAIAYEHPEHGKLIVSKDWFEHYKDEQKIGERTHLKSGVPLRDQLDKYFKEKIEPPASIAKLEQEPKSEKLPAPAAKIEPAPQSVRTPEPKSIEAPKFEVKRNKTGVEILQKIKDDRLLHTIYQYGDNKAKLDFTGLTVDDRLDYLSKTARDNETRQSDIAPEFSFKDYTFSLRVPSGLSADEVRSYLLKHKLAKPYDPADQERKQYDYFSIHATFDRFVEGLDETEKEELIDKYPDFLKRMGESNKYVLTWLGPEADNVFSVDQLERFSDNLDRVAKSSDKINKSVDLNRGGLWKYSSNYETARTYIFAEWAYTGGNIPVQKIVRDSSARIFPVNNGIKFYGSDDPPKYSQPRIDGHLKALKNETEDFYKKKFKTDDLSTKPLKAERGVGGHIDTYTPAATESWTADKRTVDRFGKMMSKSFGKDKGKYSALTVDTNYSNVLWSYESAKGKYGWPEEKELKGKKEFVLLGGDLRSVKVDHYVASKKG